MKVEYTNKLNLPPKIVQAIKARDYKGYVPDALMSVSGLLRPNFMWAMGQYYKDRDITVYKDVSMEIAALLGSVSHSVFESLEGNYIKERTFTSEIDVDGKKYLISGTPDLFDVDLGELIDFKTTSVYTAIYESRNKEWSGQLNFYSWLMRNEGLNVKSIEINACYKDWSKRDAEYNEKYPQAPAQQKIFYLRPQTQNKKIVADIIRNKLILYNSLNWGDKLSGCSNEERWQKPTSWAVWKKGNLKASKIFSEDKFENADIEAEKYRSQATAKNPKNLYFIEHRPGKMIRCEDWCIYGLNGICPAFEKKEKK